MDNTTEIVPSSVKLKNSQEPWEKIVTGLELAAGVAFLLLTAGFVLTLIYGKNSSESSTFFGAYGDLIGGVLGTFVAYISVRLLASTLKKQINANKDNSKLNKETADVYRIQQFNEQFKILFSLYSNTLNKYKDLGNIVNSCKEDGKTITGKNYEERRDKAIEIFNKFYVTYYSIASVHFRLLYRIFQLIDDANIPTKNKTSIVKIMRCQLSPEELFILRYNAMTDNGSKMRIYINRYNLLKHLPIMSLMEFAYLRIKLDDNKENSINSEIISWEKRIKELLLSNVKGTSFTVNYGKKYRFEVKISTSKDQCDFKLSKKAKIRLQTTVATDFSFALEAFSDKDLEDFLLNFAKELFLYSNFTLYNSCDSLDIKPEITEKKEEQKKIISVIVKKKDFSPLICSQHQLEQPVDCNRPK